MSTPAPSPALLVLLAQRPWGLAFALLGIAALAALLGLVALAGGRRTHDPRNEDT